MAMPAARPALRALGEHPRSRGADVLLAAASCASPPWTCRASATTRRSRRGGWCSPACGKRWRMVPTSEATPPLYYLVAWVWSKPFGTGEVGPARAFGAGGHRGRAGGLRRRQGAGVPAGGLVAAALVATSPMLVWYSQEARSYSLLVLLTALSFLLFATRAGAPSAGCWPAGRAVSALALATHYFALFVVAPEIVWLLAGAGESPAGCVAVGRNVAAGLVAAPAGRRCRPRAARRCGSPRSRWASVCSARGGVRWWATREARSAGGVRAAGCRGRVGLPARRRADPAERRGGLVALADRCRGAGLPTGPGRGRRRLLPGPQPPARPGPAAGRRGRGPGGASEPAGQGPRSPGAVRAVRRGAAAHGARAAAAAADWRAVAASSATRANGG